MKKNKKIIIDCEFQEVSAANPGSHYFEILISFQRIDGLWYRVQEATEIDMALGFRGAVQSKSEIALDGLQRAVAAQKKELAKCRAARKIQTVTEELQTQQNWLAWVRRENGKIAAATKRAVVAAIGGEIIRSSRGNPILMVPRDQAKHPLLSQLKIQQFGDFDFTCVREKSGGAQ